MITSKIVECCCYSQDHILVFRYDDEFLDIGVHLNPKRSFWQRLKLGVRYIFGKSNDYKDYDFDCFELFTEDPESLPRLLDISSIIDKAITNAIKNKDKSSKIVNTVK